MQKEFILDLNKCVGCHACIVACSIENKLSPTLLWREVTTYNLLQKSAVPLFHYSIACNHCDDPPCLENCPALAYTKDESTGAVMHHDEKCIGCRYCTWTCPYDAPKFNQRTGLVEKCTFCLQRLQEGLLPACVNLCPTGALSYGDKTESSAIYFPEFDDRAVDPSIRIIPVRKENKRPVIVPVQPEQVEEQFKKVVSEKPLSKIKLKNEWPLVVFTLTAPVLVGWLLATLMTNVTMWPVLYLFLGVIALLLSGIHLGRKARAYRALLNLKQSWLSREVFFYALLAATSFFYFITGYIPWIGWIAFFYGLITLISIDRVYFMTRSPVPSYMQSAGVLLTGILMYALISGEIILTGILLGVKLILYAYRKIRAQDFRNKARTWLAFIRILLGFVMPALAFFHITPFSVYLLFFMILVAEVTDRIEFYLEAEIMTPSLFVFIAKK